MSNLKDEIGKRYGRLTVLSRGPNTKSGLAQWNCKCDCGNELLIRGSSLRNGHTQSCGCLQKEKVGEIGRKILTGNKPHNFVDLTSKKFGKLTVLGLYEIINGKTHWKCLCECGKITYPSTYDLKNKTLSCGCVKSYKELEILNILNKNNIKYKYQHHFQNLVNPKTKYYLYYDFAIFEKDKLIGLIEYNGEQHYLTKERGMYTAEKIKGIKERDKIKVEYCENNNIPLLILNKTNIKLEEDILLWINNLQKSN